MMTLTPAYRRDYTSVKSVMADFANGKDFVVNDIFSEYDGCVVNKQDLKNAGPVKIRFNKLRKVLIVNN